MLNETTKQILSALMRGFRYTNIAKEIHVSPEHGRRLIKNAMLATGTKTTTHLAVYAIGKGWIKNPYEEKA